MNLQPLPATVLACLLAAPVIAQDECATAVPILEGFTAGTNFGASRSSPTGSCGRMGSDIWYVYRPTCSGLATASFCAAGATANFDTVLAAFSGTCGSLTEIACDDDTCGTLSEIEFATVVGQVYYIAVGGFRGAQGNFTLSLTCRVPAPGDECITALPLVSRLTPGTNVGATTSRTTGSCGFMGSDVWYTYQATCTGVVRVSFCAPGAGANFDTVLAAFAGTCGSLSEITCNNDVCSQLSQIRFPVVEGQTYYIAVGGKFGAQGTFSLFVACNTSAPGDDCVTALPITEGFTSGSTLGATTSPRTGSCGSMGSDVWYAYQATCTGTATASFCAPGAGANFDTVVAAFSGTCALLTEVACNNDSCGQLSEVSFPVVAGQTYYIAVGGFGGRQGDFMISLWCAADDCAAASTITEGFTLGSNVGATVGTPRASCGEVGRDIWYAYQPSCTGTATVSFCASGAWATYDTVLAAFSGSCGALTELTCNDDTCELLSEIEFPVVAGQTYYIAVGGWQGASGVFNLSITCRHRLWKHKEVVPSGVEGAAAAHIDQKIYVSHGSNGGEVTDLRIYDANSDTWTAGPSAASPRAGLAGAAVAGKYYAIGGSSSTVLSDVEVFDPVASTWSVGPAMPTARGGLGAAVLNGRIHVVGGRDGTSLRSGTASSAHEVLDPSSGWSTRAPLPVAVGDCYATVAVAGKLYVFGGWDGTAATAGTQIYDPVTDTWSMGAPMPTARDNAVAGVFNVGAMAGRPIVIGGLDPTGVSTNAAEMYDPVTNTWSALPAKPTAGAEMAAGGISTGCAIHAIGSGPAGLASNVHESLVAAEPAEVPRLGSPPNPAAFLPGQTSAPEIGLVWDPKIDHTSFLPGAALDFILITPAGLFNFPTPFGTVLCNVTLPTTTLLSLPGAAFNIQIPNQCSLVGGVFCAQGGAADLVSIQLANALDVTIGGR